MMPNFPKPKFPYAYTVSTEVQRLRAHKTVRQIPARGAATLLIATWNIANFGGQERRDQDKQLIAEILSWFDIIAVQETKGNFGDLMDVQHLLGGDYRVLMSDPAGNDERMAFLYDAAKLTLLEQIGEVGVPPSEHASVKLPGVKLKFAGFDRNPYIGTWQAGQLSLLLANCHLFYGSEETPSVQRRSLETFAVARWAELQEKSRFAYTRHILALGDFNMPRAEAGDPIFDALTAKGMEIPQHSTKVPSSVVSDAQYDQIALFPQATKSRLTGQKGVFDFDAVVFPDLWQRSPKDFRTYVKYYLSDHRPMWMELSIV